MHVKSDVWINEIRLFKLNAPFAVSATETVEDSTDLGWTFDSNVTFHMCRTEYMSFSKFIYYYIYWEYWQRTELNSTELRELNSKFESNAVSNCTYFGTCKIRNEIWNGPERNWSSSNMFNYSNTVNRQFSRWRHLTTTTRIHLFFAFLYI